MTATITTTTNLSTLKKSALAELVQTRLGYTAPKSWTAKKMIDALQGERHPRSAVAKAAMKDSYKAKTGVDAPKTWTCAKLSTALQAPVTPLPKSKGAKEQAIAAYVAATGVQPAKSWTTQQIADATKEGRKPGVRGTSNGLTAEACKKLLSDARKAGTEVPAYSKLKADELRALVASLKLA